MIRFVIIVLLCAAALFFWQRHALTELRTRVIETGIETRKLTQIQEAAAAANAPLQQVPFDVDEVVVEVTRLITTDDSDGEQAFLESLIALEAEQIVQLHAAVLASTKIPEKQREDIAAMFVMTLVDTGNADIGADLAAVAPNAEQTLAYVFELWGRLAPAGAKQWIESALKSGNNRGGLLE